MTSKGSLQLESGHQRYFRAREHTVEHIVRTAWLDRFVVSVYVDRDGDDTSVSKQNL